MLHHCPMPHRKLFASSFLPSCSATVPRRPVISSAAKRSREISGRVVSCRHVPLLPHAGWETIRKQFPSVMNHIAPKSDRKLFANSFLPPCSANVPRRMGNYPRTVSCRYAPPMPHAAQETIREQFPAAMLRHCPTPDGKLFANSFLSLCSTTAPCLIGNHKKRL